MEEIDDVDMRTSWERLHNTGWDGMRSGHGRFTCIVVVLFGKISPTERSILVLSEWHAWRSGSLYMGNIASSRVVKKGFHDV